MAVRIPICGGEGEGMNRRKFSHVAAVGILAVLLALPGPAGASSLQTRSVGSMWQWLVSLWSHELSVLSPGNGGFQKEGPGIDPNGGKPAGSGGTNSSSNSGEPIGSIGIEHGSAPGL
jgi:hypothetical protein